MTNRIINFKNYSICLNWIKKIQEKVYDENNGTRISMVYNIY